MVVTRFAPSPTGYVHIGSLRTVLYNYLFAKKNNGKFLLRVEDTDRNRLVEGSVKNLLNVLASVGLIPDEGPNNPGDLGPYFQSERLEIYKKYINELIKNDKAYYCFCSSERIENLRNEQKQHGLATKYDKKCRYLSKEEILEKLNNKKSYTIRLKVPENIEVVFDDIIKGKVKVLSKDIDEQILLKTDGFPTYHLANVVDDHLMNVTRVIRGDEWTPSTPKHILLYDAFGWEKPIFAHIPLLLGKDRKKLSKRTGDVSVESYLEKGYLVESLINYISLLGWNPKTTQEFFTINELINKFELVNVHKSGAIFDIEKLNHFNSHYLKTMDINLLYDKYIYYLSKYDSEFYSKIKDFGDNYNKKVLNELKSKIKKFDEIKQNSIFLYGDNKKVDINLLLNEKMQIDSFKTVKKGLEISKKILENNGDFNSVEDIKNIFVKEISNENMKNGQVLWSTRVALSSSIYSPGAFEMIYILGNEESLIRIKKVLDIL